MTRSTLSRRARNSASVMIVRRRPASRPSRRRCFLASRRVEPLTAVGSSRCERGSRTRVVVPGGSSFSPSPEPPRRRRRRRRLVPPSPSSPCSSGPVPPASSAASPEVSDAVPAWSSSAWLRPRRPRPPRRRRLRPAGLALVGGAVVGGRGRPRRRPRRRGVGRLGRRCRGRRWRRRPGRRGHGRSVRRGCDGPAGLGALSVGLARRISVSVSASWSAVAAGSSSATRSAGACAGAVARRRRGATGSGAWKSRPKVGHGGAASASSARPPARRARRRRRLVVERLAGVVDAAPRRARARLRRCGSVDVAAAFLARLAGALAGWRLRRWSSVAARLRVAFFAGGSRAASRAAAASAALGVGRSVGRRRRHRHPARRRGPRPSWWRGGAWASRRAGPRVAGDVDREDGVRGGVGGGLVVLGSHRGPLSSPTR